jgi:integrase
MPAISRTTARISAAVFVIAEVAKSMSLVGRRTTGVESRQHRASSGGVSPVFPSTAGTPLNKANVRKRVWMPLLKRAEIRYRDMYSLRWTFVSLARASGEAAFNVSRVIGHARSTIVDTIYAHTVDSALAGVGESVGERLGLTLPHDGPRPPTRRTRHASPRSSA